jgi:YHS domain-containing protein
MKKMVVSVFGSIALVTGILAVAATVSSCCGAGMLMRGGSCMGTSSTERPSRAPEQSGGAGTAKVSDDAVCPVDGMKVRVAADTPSAEYRGRRYYFCNEAEKRAFLEQPDRYAGR